MAALTYNPSTQQDEAEELSILGQATIHNEFQISLGYPPRPCVKQTNLEITEGNTPVNNAHSRNSLIQWPAMTFKKTDLTKNNPRKRFTHEEQPY